MNRQYVTSPSQRHHFASERAHVRFVECPAIPRQPQGWNIAPFKPGPSCVSHPSPTAPSASWGTGTVDEAWKTRQCDSLFEVRHADRGGSGRDREHRPFQSPKRSLAVADTDGTAWREWNIVPFNRSAELRFPPFAHRAFGFMGDRRRGRSVENALPLSFWSGSAGSRTERQATSSEADPQGKREPTPLLINGSALAGLSTLCPRRRSPVNQVAVGKGWVTPSNDLGRWRVRSFAAPPARSPQDRKHRPFRIRCRRTGNGVPDQRRPEKHRPFQFRGESNRYGYRRHGAGMEHRPIQSGELRFARCVTRVCGRAGRVLATRFHHVLKRTPTEVRNALAYVLLNARQRYGVLKMPFVSASRASWSLVDPTNDHLPVGGQKASPSSRHAATGA